MQYFLPRLTPMHSIIGLIHLLRRLRVFLAKANSRFPFRLILRFFAGLPRWLLRFNRSSSVDVDFNNHPCCSMALPSGREGKMAAPGLPSTDPSLSLLPGLAPSCEDTCHAQAHPVRSEPEIDWSNPAPTRVSRDTHHDSFMENMERIYPTTPQFVSDMRFTTGPRMYVMKYDKQKVDLTNPPVHVIQALL